MPLCLLHDSQIHAKILIGNYSFTGFFMTIMGIPDMSYQAVWELPLVLAISLIFTSFSLKKIIALSVGR